MKVIPLPTETAARTGFNTLIIVTHEDLTETAANTAQTLALLSVAPGDIIGKVATVLKTPFQDTADAALNTTTLIVGDDGSTNRFLASQELNLNGTEVTYKTGANTTAFVYTAANTVDGIFGSMTAKTLAQLNAGELHIYVGLTRLATLEAAMQY